MRARMNKKSKYIFIIVAVITSYLLHSYAPMQKTFVDIVDILVSQVQPSPFVLSFALLC